ncbi:MAG: ATPase, T2SS/T4P/T4SS family [Kiritimatiellia bacterium]|jgi:pilus assembly protein CpaF
MHVLTLYKSGDAPVKIELADGSCMIGRNERCRICLPDPTVSERHALLLVSGDTCTIEDLGSENGTYINAMPVRKASVVLPSTPVTIGPYTLTITHAAEDPEPPAAASAAIPSPQPPPPAVASAPQSRTGRASSPPQPSPAPKPGPETPFEPLKTDPALELKRSIKSQIHRELVERLDIKRLSAQHIDADELRRRASETVAAIIAEIRSKLPPALDPDDIGAEILDEALGLGPLEKLLADDTVTEIMVNGPDRIFVEKNGRIQLTPHAFTDSQSVMAVIERIVAPLGRRVDESQPYVDARLPDGSRVNCIIHPLSLVGPCITIRKFARRQLFDKDLIRLGTLTPEMAEFLNVCVKMRKNIVVSGGTGSGKTTLLNVLSNYLPPDERILTIEDAAELRLHQPHLVRLEARPPNIEGRGAITIRDLVRNALRMRPDRIIVGECRGGEALDMLQAMNTGHDGSLTTVHANAPRDVISRLETMVLMSGMDLPSRAIREQIASAIDIVVHESRLSDGSRKVTCIAEVVGLEGNQITMQDLFEFVQTGISAQGRVIGHFRPTGAVPTFYGDLGARGFSLDIAMFQPKTEHTA